MPSVGIPIIDQLVHPSIGLLTRSASLGVFSGGGTLTPPQNPLVALTYGLTWDFFTVPVGFGFAVGDPNIYFDRILQLSSEYVELGGHSILTQVADVRTDGDKYMWEEPLPLAVHYYIAPGVSVTFFWLQT